MMTLDAHHFDVPWVIESKFEPNRPRLDLVRRDRLLAQMRDAAEKKLALIIAPAGYGKSSLLGQWAMEAEERGVQYGWLTLESAEADEKQFLAYLVLLLARVGLRLEGLETGARDGFADAPVAAVLSKLIRVLNENNRKIILILEDYHNAECEAVNRIVKRLIRDTLADFTIFIDSRRQPNIDAFSLIASGDAIEIGAAQLRLTREETLQVLSGVIDERGGADIYEQTEGWPVAVQLALVQKRVQPSEPMLTGVDGGLVASYLTEQILSTLGPEAQEFLLAVAFLDRFNPELTNHVLDTEGAWTRIDALSSFAALIVPLDVSRRWYRLHHLLAEYLREVQIRRNQAWANAIQLRASAWYYDKKQVVDAVRYAARAGDYAQCERLILAAGGWKIILNDGIGVLRNALRLLPDDVIGASARLLIARAYLHCKYGEIPEARAVLDAAAQVPCEGDRALRDKDRLVVESMINLYEDRMAWTDDHCRIRARYDSEGDLDALERGTIRCEEVLISLARGDFDTAQAKVRDAFALMRQSGSVLGLNYCYIHAAHIAFHRGDFAAAAANIDRASKMAGENFGSDSGLTVIASVLEMSLKTWRGACGPEDLEPFKEALFHTVDNDGWTDLYITGLVSIIMLSRQCADRQTAVDVIGKLGVFAEQRNLVRLKRFVDVTARSLAPPVGGARADGPSPYDFAVEYDETASPRDWQAFLLAAGSADICEADDRESADMDIGGRETGGGKEDPRSALSSAIDFAGRLGAGPWLVATRLEKAAAHLDAKQSEEAKAALADALKTATALGAVGPFLAERRILRLLNEVRSGLRHDENELITLQFVDGILERAKALNPLKDSGILSDREFEVLARLADGLSNKEIARSLELTENTVKFHLKSLFSKLSVSKRVQAVTEARRRGLID